MSDPSGGRDGHGNAAPKGGPDPVATLLGPRPLQGRRALVTGAGIGIGLACARALAAAGASVVFHYHPDPDEAEAGAEEARASGVTAVALPGDLSTVEETLALADRSIEALGGLDIIVSNAGVTITKPFEETEPSDFDWLYALNVRAGYLLVQRALPRLAESGHASVVLMSSIHGAMGFPNHSAYAATKGALVALGRQLAIELAPQDVRVNVIEPGLIEVPRYFEGGDYSSEEGAKTVPIRRVGTPEDVAAAVLYLVSDAARFVTGTTLAVDGGGQAFGPAEAVEEDDEAS